MTDQEIQSDSVECKYHLILSFPDGQDTISCTSLEELVSKYNELLHSDQYVYGDMEIVAVAGDIIDVTVDSSTKILAKVGDEEVGATFTDPVKAVEDEGDIESEYEDDPSTG